MDGGFRDGTHGFDHTGAISGVSWTTRRLESIVAPAFGIRAETLHAVNRGSASVAFARQVAMYLAHTRLGLSYVAVGSLFGRDRTTAAHACRQVEERRDDPRLDSILDYLEHAVDLCQKPAGLGEAPDA